MVSFVALALIIAAISGSGFVVNEWSHGSLSEAMGMGHHHMLDYGGVHCASHDDPERGAAHMEHMHGNSPPPHDDCSGGPGMHRMGA